MNFHPHNCIFLFKYYHLHSHIIMATCCDNFYIVYFMHYDKVSLGQVAQSV